jgi:putative ABC transport system permease protein
MLPNIVSSQRSDEQPIRFFITEHLQRLYQAELRQAQAFALCSLLAVALSCIGLFATVAAAAERRTREIALRKALGAKTGAIVRLLLWQFTRPVLWGVLLAWPVTAWLMQRWLQGFAYHIALPLWLFVLAALAAFFIAIATVTMQTLAVTGTRPAHALRYD